MKFKLSDRKKKILSALVSENIRSASSVSSKDLQEKYFDEISSATIRNELMALEELGLLFQPHTSSGRIPTENGFRTYIEELMPETKLSRREMESIRNNFCGKITEMETLARDTARVISDATNYASVVYMGVFDDARIENIKIVKLTDESALVVVVTDVGIIKDITMPVVDISEDDCFLAGKLLSESLAGHTLAELHSADNLIKSLAKKYRLMFDMVLTVIDKRNENREPRIDGATNLLRQPEYKDIDRAKKAVALFENREKLIPLLRDGNDLEISIRVGNDSDIEDCSIVTAEFKVNGKRIGHAGVIGPMRMDYAKAISVLKSVSDTINDKFYKGKKGDDK